MVALIVEVGCCLCILAAPALESSSYHTSLIKAAPFFFCLVQDVISKVWQGAEEKEHVVSKHSAKPSRQVPASLTRLTTDVDELALLGSQL